MDKITRKIKFNIYHIFAHFFSDRCGVKYQHFCNNLLVMEESAFDHVCTIINIHNY